MYMLHMYIQYNESFIDYKITLQNVLLHITTKVNGRNLFARIDCKHPTLPKNHHYYECAVCGSWSRRVATKGILVLLWYFLPSVWSVPLYQAVHTMSH